MDDEEEEQEDSEQNDDDEEEEDESEEPPAPIAPRELPKRSTRGQRMNVLVGKALEEDEQFWKQGLFGAGGKEDVGEASDESYNSKAESESAGKDSFDSDFDRSDNDIENSDDDD
jgi:vacuolar protein sorting-associated protein 72